MMKQTSLTRNEAELIAIRALEFLASDPDRLGRFLTLSGVSPATLREGMGDPAFLAGVLDHLLGDESLLFEFCAFADIDASVPATAHTALVGGR